MDVFDASFKATYFMKSLNSNLILSPLLKRLELFPGEYQNTFFWIEQCNTCNLMDGKGIFEKSREFTAHRTCFIGDI